MKSIIPDDNDDQCYICHMKGCYLQIHHMLHGSRRKKADEYGLTVHLCVKCHMKVHDIGTWDLELEQRAQQVFEEKYGHKKFMQEFGKNYL